MALKASEIDDLVQLTLNNFIKRGTFVNMQTDLTDHVAVREMWKQRKTVFNGGKEWEFQIQMDHNHSAKMVGMFESDSSSFNDTMTNGSVPVRHINAHYIYDKHEPSFQGGASEIVDIILTRTTGMQSSVFEKMEQQLWSKPTDSSDKHDLFGIPYWVVKNPTVGLTGGNPAGFTSGAAGIDSTVYPRWKNFSGSYTNVSETDLLAHMRRSHVATKFRSPLSNSETTLGGMKNGIYVNEDTHLELEKLFDERNMNLGSDLGGKAVQFKGTPITYAPFLNEDSSDPVYMIDWKYMTVGAMAGWENNLTPPYMVPGKHNVRRVDMDASMNMICVDRRRQAVLYKA